MVQFKKLILKNLFQTKILRRDLKKQYKKKSVILLIVRISKDKGFLDLKFKSKTII